jgi:hypothetical protein
MASPDVEMTPHAVIPAKAGSHFDFWRESKMDSGFRRNDEVKSSRVKWNARTEAK